MCNALSCSLILLRKVVILSNSTYKVSPLPENWMAGFFFLAKDQLQQGFTNTI